MMTGAWLSSAAGAAWPWPWLAHVACRPDTLAVIDPTLANSPAFANYVAQMKLPVFETGEDIGLLWYTTLAPRFKQTPARSCASLIGLTRASDYFVLRELATRAGHMVEHSSERGERPVAHVAFALTPRLVRLRSLR